MGISQSDINILRELGKRYMEIATLPIQQEKTNLWKSLNRGKMERPMVVIDQLPWHELFVQDELACKVSDPFWRDIELNLRMTIFRWTKFPVDMVVEPFITIPRAINNTGYGIQSNVDTLKHSKYSSILSQHYNNVIASIDDVSKIQDMEITHNKEVTNMRLQQALEIFKDIAPIKLSGGISFHLGVWDTLSMLMGVEPIYYALIDAPELLHAAMDRITDATIAGIEKANELKVHNDLASTCHCSYIYTDDLLPDSGSGKGPISQNCWAFGMAQLFTSVSPDVFKEFELPYITKMAKYFSNIYYGCCERLDNQLDLVATIPNIRKVSCSPWNNVYAFSERLNKKLILSNKPNPAYIGADSVNYSVIKNDLQKTCDAARRNNLNVEFILKDISTVHYDIERLSNWSKIAMDIVENY